MELEELAGYLANNRMNLPPGDSSAGSVLMTASAMAARGAGLRIATSGTKRRYVQTDFSDNIDAGALSSPSTSIRPLRAAKTDAEATIRAATAATTTATALPVNDDDSGGGDDSEDELSGDDKPGGRVRGRGDRRTKKNIRERQRRMEINDAFEELATLLEVSRKNKADKTSVLVAAISAIKDLRQQVGQLSGNTGVHSSVPTDTTQQRSTVVHEHSPKLVVEEFVASTGPPSAVFPAASGPTRQIAPRRSQTAAQPNNPVYPSYPSYLQHSALTAPFIGDSFTEQVGLTSIGLPAVFQPAPVPIPLPDAPKPTAHTKPTSHTARTASSTLPAANNGLSNRAHPAKRVGIHSSAHRHVDLHYSDPFPAAGWQPEVQVAPSAIPDLDSDPDDYKRGYAASLSFLNKVSPSASDAFLPVPELAAPTGVVRTISEQMQGIHIAAPLPPSPDWMIPEPVSQSLSTGLDWAQAASKALPRASSFEQAAIDFYLGEPYSPSPTTAPPTTQVPSQLSPPQ